MNVYLKIYGDKPNNPCFCTSQRQIHDLVHTHMTQINLLFKKSSVFVVDFFGLKVLNFNKLIHQVKQFDVCREAKWTLTDCLREVRRNN